MSTCLNNAATLDAIQLMPLEEHAADRGRAPHLDSGWTSRPAPPPSRGSTS
jgi:hypothetical protein